MNSSFLFFHQQSAPSSRLVHILAVALVTLAACGAPKGDNGDKKSETKAIPAKRPSSETLGAEALGAEASGANDTQAAAATSGVQAQGTEAQSTKDMASTTGASAVAGTTGDAPTFRKGDLALNGLIADHVAIYNKAQGDPVEGAFGLEQAFEGAPELADRSKGKLNAIFHTTMGDVRCQLYDEEAPLTVANFVGLARGTRPFLDRKTREWIKRPFYDDVLFHRVIKGFMVQTGDPTGSGMGGPGYFVVDEFSKKSHDRPGILSMANRNPVDPATEKLYVDPKSGKPLGNTGSSQFFITVAPTPRLDGRHTVFGHCEPKVPLAIADVRVENRPELRIDHRPLEPIKIKTITFERRAKK